LYSGEPTIVSEQNIELREFCAGEFLVFHWYPPLVDAQEPDKSAVYTERLTYSVLSPKPGSGQALETSVNLQVLGRGDYFKLEFDTAAKRSHGAPNRYEFQRSQLTELRNTDFESWAKESFEIATKIAYRNGAQIGIPKAGLCDGRGGSRASRGLRYYCKPGC
jgi:hypothetical protein